jgi:hypothetical protein
MNYKTLLFLAMSKAIKQYSFVNVSDKNICPIYNRKRNKIQTIWIAKFILATHLAKVKKITDVLAQVEKRLVPAKPEKYCSLICGAFCEALILNFFVLKSCP